MGELAKNKVIMIADENSSLENDLGIATARGAQIWQSVIETTKKVA